MGFAVVDSKISILLGLSLILCKFIVLFTFQSLLQLGYIDCSVHKASATAAGF